MAFTLGSRLTPNLPLPQYLGEAATCFQIIEIPTDPRFLSLHFPLNGPSKKTLRIYQERYRFRFTLHAPFVSLGAPHQEMRLVALSQFRSALQVAEELGIELVTFHPSVLTPDISFSYPEICRREEESIALLLVQAKSAGIILAMENMPNDPNFHPATQDGSRLLELLSLFPEPELGVTIDIGHALQAGVDPWTLLALDRVCHFHLHENDRLQDRHQRIIQHLDWWERLVREIKEKFPHSVGILEMNHLVDQFESYDKLSPFIKE